MIDNNANRREYRAAILAMCNAISKAPKPGVLA